MNFNQVNLSVNKKLYTSVRDFVPDFIESTLTTSIRQTSEEWLDDDTLTDEERSSLLNWLAKDFRRGQITPGINVGVKAGSSLGQPITQTMLSSFKTTGTSSFTSVGEKYNITKLIQLNENQASSHCYIYPKNLLASPAAVKASIQRLAYTTFRDLILPPEIQGTSMFVELQKSSVLRWHVHAKFLNTFICEDPQYTSTIKSFDKGELVVKYINGDKVSNVLAMKFLGMKNSTKEVCEHNFSKLLDRKVWGLKKISFIEKNADWTGAFVAHGSDLSQILGSPFVDVERTYSDNIRDTFEHLGIEAVRTLLIKQIHKMADLPDVFKNNNINLLADQMTRIGKVVPVNRKGLEDLNAGFLRVLSFESVTKSLQKLAVTTYDSVEDPSSRIITGKLF